MLVFDIKGFFAFFRKHFSTTSALSYSFPPRTTIAGIVAAALGYERDSYYTCFSSERCRIGLQVRSLVRHVTNAVNYLMTDGSITLEKLRGCGGSMPIHLDMLVSGETEPLQLSYRIYFSHKDEELMGELSERIRVRKFLYPPSLGAACNIAELEYIALTEAEVYKPEGEVEVHTVLPVSALRRIYPRQGRIYLEELVPAEFTEERRLKREESYVYEAEGRPIRVIISSEAFSCTVNGERIVGTFM